MVLLAIDPGLNGALGLFKGALIECVAMPDLTPRGMLDLRDKVLEWGVTHVVIEAQCGWGNSGESKNGPKGLFTQGLGYGKLLALFYLCGLEPVEVSSNVWMSKVPLIEVPKDIEAKALSKKRFKGTKLRTLAWAHHLGVNIWGPRGRLLDGIADATCLGWVYSNRLLAESYYKNG